MPGAEINRQVTVEVTQLWCLLKAHLKHRTLDARTNDNALPIVLKQVFDHDDHARDQQMSPEARLVYHQAYSRPLMDELKNWLDKQCDDRLVEPNSSLGKAIAYMQGHWETLTRFLSVPGAPIDNNVVERAVKLCLRQRKNALFDQSEDSASSASVLTTLLATCLYASVHGLDALVALQEHRAAVFADPSAWLPWTYQASLAPP